MLRAPRVVLAASLALIACDRTGVEPHRDAGVSDGGTDTDAGPKDGGDVTVGCENPPIEPAPSGETCSYTAGDSNILIRGDIVVPEGLLENGHLLIGSDGKVACAACDCSSAAGFSGATVVACANGLISPGLINTHEHLTFGEGSPINHDPERFEHRHDWREGNNGHTELRTPGSSSGSAGPIFAELRHLVGGATSVNGSGSGDGLLRNLDRSGADQLGLNQDRVRYDTFPLGDSGGQTRESGCDYQSLPTPNDSQITGALAYTPHIAEGIGRTAQNEFTCIYESAGSDIFAKTAVIHGVGLTAADYALMAAEGTSLIWSARTNIDLYGHTAPVTLAANSGVLIALGTDWPASGSMNVLRELACFADYNQRNLGGFFTERQLFDMATVNAATALKSEGKIGSLAPGLFADVAIFDTTQNAGYLAAIRGEPKTVALVLRGGEPLYGDAELMTGLGAQPCETLDVCGTQKRLCVMQETGMTLADVENALDPDTLDLFACGAPQGEPTCIPFRMGEFDGISVNGDQDGDGIPDDRDNCPSIFNAPRDDLDQGVQADADDDMLGDACDVCPLDPNSTTCSTPDPNDRDNDGVPNAMDNCPSVANPDQADRDNDLIGDACDQCPDEPNPGGAACTARVYDVKQGNVTGRVRLSDILVTAVSDNGYFVQRVAGDPGYDATLEERYSGIFVFNASEPKPAVGDRVDVEGDVGDFFGQTQLSSSTFTVVSSGNPPPAPVSVSPDEVATGGSRAAELEAVVVSVGTVTVTNVDLPPGPGDSEPTNEVEVEGTLRVNDYLYLPEPPLQVNDVIGNLQGVLRFANENSKLEPRGPEDLGIPPRLSGFDPTTVYATAGINGAVPPGGFAVLLSRPADQAVTVTLSSGDPGLTVPASVDIPAGSDRADVPLTAAAPVTTTVTASYDGVMATAQVVVYDDASPRAVTELTLDRTAIPVSDTTPATVRIDLPGASGGTQVTLQVTPGYLGSVPAMVTVPAGAFEVGFDLTTNTATGTGTLSASAPGGSDQVTFTVSDSIERPPMAPGDLVITEVHRNPSVGSNEHEHEWFEVYNPTTDTISVDGLVVTDNNQTQMLSAPGATVPPGGYAVIAFNGNPTQNGGVMPLATYGANPNLLLANGDDEIHISYMGTEIDVVDWSGTWPGGQGVSMCLKFPYAADNNDAAAWGDSVGAFGDGDQGSPGVASDATNCP